MKRKSSAKKTKTSPARAKAKPAGKPAARKAAAKAPGTSVSRPPKAAVYTPKPIEGVGWAPFRYSR